MLPGAFAEVAVNVPTQRGRAAASGDAPRTQTYHYHVPADLEVQAGHLVWVSFGAQHVQGLVLALSDSAPVAETKPILSICDPQPYLTTAQQHLARWLAEHYLCSAAEAAFLFLPPGIEQRMLTLVDPVADPPTSRLQTLNDAQQRVWQIVQSKPGSSVEEIVRVSRLPRARAIIDQLLRRDLVTKRKEMEAQHVRPKMVRTTRLVVDQARVHEEIARLIEPNLRRARTLRAVANAPQGLAPDDLIAQARSAAATVSELLREGLLRREEKRGPLWLGASADIIQERIAKLETPPATGMPGLLTFLAEHPEAIDVAELVKVTGASTTTLRQLAERGLVKVEEREVRRDPLALRRFTESTAPALTAEQQRVYGVIRDDLAAEPPHPVLLHGVTGSGKTEIYLRVLRDALNRSRQAIIMVPEIALTPQTINRFASRFPGNVAVLHSRLSPGERFDEWRRIRDGQVDIVIGSRSAVFAPLPRLGLIIIDEEHEWTYKQSDVAPRYHAREVALKLADLTGSLVVMGSATPDVASYQRAADKEYILLEMGERVVRAEGKEPLPGNSEPGDAEALSVVESPLPEVEIVDLRAELRAGNRSIFSRALHNAMTVALAAKQQVILFLNRRGSATFIMCRDCGHVLRCKSCDAPLAFHQAEDDLVCHQCNRRYLSPDVCPLCWSKRVKFFGIGTQKVEEEVHRLFPSARTLRWDRDATAGKMAHELILDRFVGHEADVLIGTQMIAKGLDLPLVTLVGVVSADTALHLPDFRAGERTFQILTQVAGRAGRSALGGRVIFQTYTPEHYAIQAASRHDYKSFAAQELAFRARKGYPPFSRMARLILQHSNKQKAQAEAEGMHQALRLRVDQRGLPAIRLTGPAPCFVSRLRGRYRWQIIIQAADVYPLLAGLPLPDGWIVDVDPVSVL